MDPASLGFREGKLLSIIGMKIKRWDSLLFGANFYDDDDDDDDVDDVEDVDDVDDVDDDDDDGGGGGGAGGGGGGGGGGGIHCFVFG